MLTTLLTAAVLTAPSAPLPPLIDAALQRHPQLAAARATLAASEARAAAVRSAYWPQVGVSSGLSRTTNLSFADTATQPILLTNGGLSVRQQVWDFGKTAAEAEAADANVDAQRAAVALAGVEVAYAVRRAYFDWLEAASGEARAKTRLKASNDVLAQARGYFAAGKRAKIEAVRAEADQATATADVVAARVAAEQAKRALAAALGSEPPAGPGVFPALPAVAAEPLGALRERAMRGHPSLATARARVVAGDARQVGAERAAWPDLNADVSYGLRFRDAQPGQNWGAGLSVSAPLFTGFAQTNQVKAATAEAEATRFTAANAARDVALAIERAALALGGARERQPASAAAARAARETWRLAAGRYKAGVGTAVEVADARALLAAAEQSEVKAQADVHRAVADLWRALGETGQ